MDNSEALQLLEELDQIRVNAGMPRMDEVSRRDFMKKMGAGAVAAGATAAGMAPGTAQGAGSREYIQGMMRDFENVMDTRKIINDYIDSRLRIYEPLSEWDKMDKGGKLFLKKMIKDLKKLKTDIHTLSIYVDQMGHRAMDQEEFK